jgi:alpha-galactosidase
MAAIAEKIHATGRKAGIWLAPFIIPRRSSLSLQHPDWLLKNENGFPVYAGVGWSGDLLALDSSHPEVLVWIANTIERMLTWRYDYLKLDFLYAGAMPGVYKGGIPSEIAYRNAMHLFRKVAGEETYIGLWRPIIPSLGIWDGIRTGPDVAPFWQSTPMSAWLNNPSHPGTQNGIRTSLNRLWLKSLVHVDPDVAYFRSSNNQLSNEQS